MSSSTYSTRPPNTTAPIAAPQMPVIHLNGTGRAALLEENQAARDAVQTAITALRHSSPHGRDYYPAGDQAYIRATAAHRARLLWLKGVARELEEIILSLAG